ncbi:DUF5605 domain-containing protein [Clostridium saccharoperbutylacetonicum]|uniref:DUF5605 domain-containing protein n=1 Tax=Clostridium saccharoperbutylacetonicum TaxID=36745 RepID=UPI000983D542|nr:DUF5605 domain-containing protein [Clostridium saccharoperbutylacetonicum]AQR97279.1 putative endoglucanase [Clostridium saccharoperbutylacetonicum]NSB33161.1 hypothetical protein [Clostridium saccharoperbutylacetonicum]
MSNLIEKWGLYETSFKGPKEGNPFLEVELTAVFKHKDSLVEVNGFYDGEGIYIVRFMPDIIGEWNFVTSCNIEALNGLTGSFKCVEPLSNNHGPVRVINQFHFEYTDGTPHYSFGTTCYAWIHQSMELQRKTLETLKTSPFNKIRMCVFPKHYDYNHNEPLLYPYEGSLERGFDFTKFNPEFFRHLERRILDLQELGIECDLILFHPYDRWGFSNMGKENDGLYLKYIVSRLAHFRNIWWSMANEYDLFIDYATRIQIKTMEDWERLAHIVQMNDPYQHLRSIHNCMKMYDYRRPWITHCSIQRTDVVKTSEYTNEWRDQYGKPVVIDECTYEGNINHGWGNITGQEMTRRFWEGVLRGGYVGHGETYVHPKDILWWSHGGELHGTSPSRIAFLRKIVESAPGAINPAKVPEGVFFNPYWDVTCGMVGEDYYIFYFSFNQPAFRNFNMPKENKYKVDILDTWDMTIKELEGTYSGQFRIDMPGKQYIAIRMIRVQ